MSSLPLKIKITALIYGMLLSQQSYSAEEKVSGIVHTVKNAAGLKVTLDRSPEALKKNGTVPLCRQKINEKFLKLSAMTLSLSGAWKGKNKAETACFLASSFEIVSLASGRRPLIGKLKMNKNHYYIQEENGKSSYLHKVPKKLKTLINKKVIIDPKVLVVSYAVYPD